MNALMVTYGNIHHYVGTEVGVSGWFTIDQATVAGFADLTGDAQWIHTDVARATSGPFGGTVAHGYLTLAMLPVMAGDVLHIREVASVVNYGVNRVRFPHPILVGRAIRDRIAIQSVETTATAKRLVLKHTVEIDGGESSPGCVAETVSLLLPVEEVAA